MNIEPFKIFSRKHPIFSLGVFIFIVTFISNLIPDSSTNKTQKSSFNDFQCVYLDTGLEGFPFGYDEQNKKIKYGGQNTVIKNIDFEESKIKFTVIDGDNSSDYEFNKQTRYFRMLKNTVGLENVKVGRIYCKNADEIKADQEKKKREMDDAWSAYARLKTAIAGSLKDPDSAKWEPAYVTVKQVCVTVNGKNSFGAYAGKKTYCANKQKNGDWKIEN